MVFSRFRILNIRALTIALAMLFAPILTNGSGSSDEEGLNVGKVIVGHIVDDYGWHFFTIGHFHATIPLPVILYSPTKGLDIFMSSKFDDENHKRVPYKGYEVDPTNNDIVALDGSTVYDLSITKSVASMMISLIIMIWLFTKVAKAYKTRGKQEPKGIQSLIEPIIVFVKDEIAEPMLGEKHVKYLPFLLTLFFFIWINNLLGLLPGAANLTGNIMVTLTLSFFTFVIVNFSAKKHYWGHIFRPPGVPIALYPIMLPIEFLGIFIKPVALTIRLFANITAGHMIILSLISLIFVAGQASAFAGGAVSVVSVGFTVFMFCLELLVAVLQAYIFTILSALYISDAVVTHGDEH